MNGGVHHKVTLYKSLELALKDLEPFVRNGHHLISGRPFERFGDQRSREMLANWLLCVVMNLEHKTTAYRFSSDPNGGDGLICDTTDKIGFPTEHVMVYQHGEGTKPMAEDAIAKSVADKQAKGTPYAKGKALIVFNELGTGQPWFPNRAARQMPQHDFYAVWVVGLHEVTDGRYTYCVTQLVTGADCPCWKIRISSAFDLWEVERFQ